MSIIDGILDLFVPFDCLGCHKEGKLVCRACLDKLTHVSPKELVGPDLASVFAATLYSGLAKDLLWKLKSSGAQAAAKIMAEKMAPLIRPYTNYLIVPVPTASSRIRQRGYDQARLIARELSKTTKMPFANCLARSGQAHQVGADREQRHIQLSNAFRVKKRSLVEGQNIMLVDDVVTTGSTLEIVARILKQAGAKDMQAVVFAKPVMRNPRAV